MGGLSPWHLILVLIVVLIIFGPGKLPDIGNAIGRGLREFRNATGDLEGAIRGEPARGTTTSGPGNGETDQSSQDQPPA